MVAIEANKVSMKYLRMEVKNETLYVSSDRVFRFSDIFKSRSSNIRKVYITLPQLQKITASGGSNIIVQTQFSTENM